jgi:hypothetical protein
MVLRGDTPWQVWKARKPHARPKVA